MLHLCNMDGAVTTSCPTHLLDRSMTGTSAVQGMQRLLHARAIAPRFRTQFIHAGRILNQTDNLEDMATKTDADEDVTIQYVVSTYRPGFRARIQSAITTQDEPALQLLLEAHANPDTPLPAARNRARCPLSLAIRLGAHDIARLLLMADADVNSESPNTPLAAACSRGDWKMVRLLLRNGAKADLPSARGQTPLHIAATRGNVRILRLLLKAAASIDKPVNRHRKTPLEASISKQQYSAAAYLLSARANPHAGSHRHTALHAAAKQGEPALLRLLTTCKADVTAEDQEGHRPLDLLPKHKSFARRIRCRQLLRHPQQGRGSATLQAG